MMRKDKRILMIRNKTINKVVHKDRKVSKVRMMMSSTKKMRREKTDKSKMNRETLIMRKRKEKNDTVCM